LINFAAFIATPLRKVAIAVGAAIVVFSLGYCSGDRAAKTNAENARLNANERAVSVNRKATAKADVRREADNTKLDTYKGDLERAANSSPDASPSLASQRVTCERLRHKGARLPARCAAIGFANK
jgi:hypothetical protein